MALAITKPAINLPRPKARTLLVETLRTNGHSNGRASVTPSPVRQFVQAQVTDLATAVESAGAQGLSILQKMQIALGFKPAADLRAQQMETMATEPVELSPAEKWVNRYFKETSILLGTTTLSLLIYPPLIYLNVPFIAYNSIPFWKRAYEDLVLNKRVTTTVVDATLSLGALTFAPFHPQVLAVGALGTWLFALTRKLVIKAEGRTRSELTNLFGRQPRTVWIVKDGIEIEVPFATVQAGDLVVVDAGQMIPVDGVIAEGVASIDQHALTGESQPAEKSVGDVVFAATIVLAGKIFIAVEKTGTETVAAQIGQVLSLTADFTSSVQLRGQAISDRSALPTLLLSGVALPVAGPSPALAVLFSGMGYTMKILGPLSVLNFLQITSHHGILIKDGRALEQISKVDTVVFDKTGTLTLEQPHVGALYPCNGYDEATLLTYAAAAEHRQTHPIARAILQAAAERELALPAIHEAAYEVGYGIQVTVDEQVIRVGSQRFMALSAIPLPPEMLALQEQAHAQGYSLVYVAVDDHLAGVLELHPTVRPEAQRIVAGLRAAGITVYIISGDQSGPTRALAEELGVDYFFAETLPEHKADHIARLQEEGRFVCFVGDGINDSIALKKAQVSISLRGASTIATDTAQIILMDQTLNQLATLFAIAEKFERNMHWDLMSSVAPGAVIIGGALLGVVSFGTSIALFYLGLTAGLVNAMSPLFVEQRVANPALLPNR
ncbi:MAG: heavy metal translocating P-type ATPase [Caldilineaceae bacterium]